MIWKELAEADVPAAAELSRIARWNQTERDWRGYLEFAPGGCQGAVIDGRLAGTVTTVCFGRSVGWIGMVLVHPDFQRQGLGTALLQRAMGYLRQKGVETIGLDATEAGRAVYLPLGFKDEYGVERLEGTLASAGSGGERGPLAPNPGQSSLAAPFAQVSFGLLAELDASAFGADRTEVLRDLAGRDPQLCFADPRGAGFLIAREGREAVQLGPWVARDLPTATRLFESLAAAAPGRRVFVDVPAGNPAAASWLRARGFWVQRSFMRMTLGGRLPPARDGWIFGTAGAEKG